MSRTNFLSRLEVGRAVLFNQSYYNAIQVQISPLNSQSIEGDIGEDEIHGLNGLASIEILFRASRYQFR